MFYAPGDAVAFITGAPNVRRSCRCKFGFAAEGAAGDRMIGCDGVFGGGDKLPLVSLVIELLFFIQLHTETPPQ